jgi:ubiquinone/menaquinone biosynthesis C-methylase UbiE
MMNDYDTLSAEYKKTHIKPDKLYSMLPTILDLVSPIGGKIIVDVGCGDGFFTFEFAKSAREVYGLDNSKNQIEEAKKYSVENTKFIFSDMLCFDYPKSDIVNVPFVLGYIQPSKIILELFQKIFASLKKNGKIVGIIDSPKTLVHDNKIFGSIKKLQSFDEGAKLTIELYNKEKIVALDAFYHTKDTIQHLLSAVGFTDIQWHEPIISVAGMGAYSGEFWKEYLSNLDIAYFSATKL